MEPFVVSLIYYAIVISLCELSRQVIAGLTTHGSRSRLFLYEVVATLQVCLCVYENALITKYYGVSSFFFVVIVLVVCHSFLNRGALVTPCATIERLLNGSLALVDFLLLLSAELLGAFLTFRFARQIWWVGLSLDHSQQYGTFVCSLAYKVPFLAACVYELVGCFLIRSIVGRTRPDLKRYAVALCTAAGLSLEMIFIGPPGLNPTIATSRTLGCRGLSTQAHLFMYWLCPILGWLGAASLDSTFRRLLTKKQE